MPKIAQSNQINTKALVVTLAVAVVVGAAVIYAEAAKPPTSGGNGGNTKGGGSAQLLLSPAKSTISAGQTFTIQVRENSGTTTVNAVQADLTYPTDKLTLDSIDDSTSAFGIKAASTMGTGTLEIARGNTTPLSGNQLVANLTFTAKAAKGNASVSFASTSALLSSTTNTNIIGSTTAATFQYGK